MLVTHAIVAAINLTASFFSSVVCYNIIVNVFKIERKKIIWSLTAAFFIFDVIARYNQLYIIPISLNRSGLEMALLQFLHALGRMHFGGAVIMVCMIIKNRKRRMFMKKKSIIQGALTILTCIFAISMIQLYVFAQGYPTNANSESEDFYIGSDSSVYEFLLNLDINNLAVLHSDGTPAGLELFDEIIQMLANRDFIGIVKFTALYELSLQVEEVSRSRMIPEEVVHFEMMSSHLMTSHLNSNQRVYMSTTTRTAIIRHSNGTVSPHENRPSVTISNLFIGTGWSINPGIISIGNRRIENNRAVEAFADIEVVAFHTIGTQTTRHNFGIARLRYRLV